MDSVLNGDEIMRESAGNFPGDWPDHCDGGRGGGGRQGATLVGPRGTADSGGWSPGWLRRCACWHGGPPHPSLRGLGALGSHPRRSQNELQG